MLLIFLVTEPVRGLADGAQTTKRSNYFSDVVQVLKMSVELLPLADAPSTSFSFSKSFLFTTLGFTWVAFALGALSWWGPIFLERAHEVSGGAETSSEKELSVVDQIERLSR